MNNILLDKLTEYPFARLDNLLAGIPSPKEELIKMYIGEPILSPPPFVIETINKYNHLFNKYPSVNSNKTLINSIYNFLNRRFKMGNLKFDPYNQIIPTSGSREGLFLAGTYLSPETSEDPSKNIYAMPNPFYQVYKGSCVLNKGVPLYLNAVEENDFQPDISNLSEEVLKKLKVFIVCNPSNPQGSFMSLEKMKKAIVLAKKYDFTIIFDECYCELYNEAPSFGAMDALNELGEDFKNVIISNTLSKRSSCPGLRSAFLVGDIKSMMDIKKFKEYGSSVLPEPLAFASAALWNDDEHVKINRSYYQENFKIADSVFARYKDYKKTQGAFYLWLKVKNDEEATKKIWAETGIKILPGSYLAETINGFNPGKNYIRVTLNYNAENTKIYLEEIEKCLNSL